MEILVIDGRSRALRAFVASVTKAQEDNPYQVVLRHALDMGCIRDLLAPKGVEGYFGGEVIRQECRVQIPVLIMGEYSARSSAGHVTVACNDLNMFNKHHKKVLVVGGLGPAFGKGGLKVLTRPISAVLIPGPVEIVEAEGADNSNCASAEAAIAGVKILARTDKKSTFLMEGQSDYTYVIRLRCLAEGNEVDFPAEHRSDMFSRENIVKTMFFGQIKRDLTRICKSAPSKEEVRAEAIRRMESYLAAKAADEDSYWRRLGRGFGALNKSDEAIKKVADGLGIEVVDEPEENSGCLLKIL